ncbi:MAG: class I SAM-dependent methyltransferase [Actinobacteria bacterium]|nr:class I SAM-dependent methyltransferase [Actinomycetota bacterium]
MLTYRERMRTMGVTSPPEIGPAAFRRIVGSSVADVGCGSGVFGFMLRSAWYLTGAWIDEGIAKPDRLIGVDFSPVAIANVKRHAIYDDPRLADATRLPLSDGEVDTALSMENIEHLFPAEIPGALAELCRVSRRRVVVTTPAPWRVIHHPWVRVELASIDTANAPMARTEFLVRSGQVHKSVLFPHQMRAAGFEFRTFMRSPMITADSIIYWADVDAIRLDRLGEVLGTSVSAYPEHDSRPHWDEAYRELLASTLDIPLSRRQPIRTTLAEVGRALKVAVRPHT